MGDLVLNSCTATKLQSLYDIKTQSPPLSLPPRLKEVKGARNPQLKYGGFICLLSRRQRNLEFPESNFPSCLLCFESITSSGLKRTSPVFAQSIHSWAVGTRLFVARLRTRCTPRCIQSYGCIQCYGCTCFACVWWELLHTQCVSETSLGEQTKNFKGSPGATCTFLISFLQIMIAQNSYRIHLLVLQSYFIGK